MKLGPAALRSRRVGAVLRAPRTHIEPCVTRSPIPESPNPGLRPPADEDPLLRHRPDRARHQRGIGARGGRGGGARGARARRDGARSRRARGHRGRRACAGSRWRRRSGPPTCAWPAPARSRGWPAASGPTRSSSGTTTSAAKRSDRRPALSAVAVLEVNAPVIDHAGSSKARARSRARSSSRCAAGASASARLADVIVTPNAAILPAGIPGGADPACSSGAPTPIGSGPASTGQAPYVRLGVTTVAIFAGAFRSWHGAIHLVEAIKILRARGEKDIGAVLVGDGSELAARAPGGGGDRHDRLHRRAAARSHAGGARRRPTSASRRSTSARTRRCRSGSTGRR